MREPNLHLEFLNTALLKESFDIQRTGLHLNNISGVSKKMDKIRKFLEQIALHTDDSKRIDFNLTAEKMQWVDEVREICPDLIPAGTYAWKNDEIKSLSDALNNHVHQILTAESQQEHTIMAHEKIQANQIFEAMSHTQRRCHYLLDRINSNMAKR